MLPPLASLDVSGLKEFDLQLANALSDVDLPDGWSLISEKKNGKYCYQVVHESTFELL